LVGSYDEVKIVTCVGVAASSSSSSRSSGMTAVAVARRWADSGGISLDVYNRVIILIMLIYVNVAFMIRDKC
jgi:hypothetical protein